MHGLPSHLKKNVEKCNHLALRVITHSINYNADYCAFIYEEFSYEFSNVTQLAHPQENSWILWHILLATVIGIIMCSIVL